MGIPAAGKGYTNYNIKSPNRREVTIISKVKEQKGGFTRKEVYTNLFTRSKEGMRNRSKTRNNYLFSDGSLNSGKGLHLFNVLRVVYERQKKNRFLTGNEGA